MDESASKKRLLEEEAAATPPAIKNKRGRKKKEACEVYEVERIVDHRYSEERERIEYFIKWKDYPETDNTWEGEDNLAGCMSLVAEYKASKAKDGDKLFTSSNEPPLGLEIEDDIDRKLVRDLGVDLGTKSWSVRKIGTGRYEIFHRRQNERASASPAPSNSSKSEVETKDPNTSSSGKVSSVRKLQKWVEEINLICERAGEAKLYVENNVDDAVITTKDFNYITVLLPGKNVDIPIENIIGCSCKTRNGSCYGKNCCPSGMGAEFAYAPNGLLLLDHGRPIYECNSKCQCDQKCANRVVQKGRKVELCIFRTSNNRGWGVKAVTNIKKNSFVVEYVGEVITKEESDKRNNDCYMFNMDFDENPQYIVDAKAHGNVSRFINHSCDPNLGVYGVWVDHFIGKLPRLAFFALRDIKAGEELSFNYYHGNSNQDASFRSNASDDEVLARKIKKKKPDDKSLCKCGSDFCRKYTFANGTKY